MWLTLTLVEQNRPHICDTCRKDNRECISNSAFADCTHCWEKGHGCYTNTLNVTNYTKPLKELHFDFSMLSFPNGDTPFIGEGKFFFF